MAARTGRPGAATPPPIERSIVFYRVYTRQEGDRIGRLRTNRIVEAVRDATPRLLGLPGDDLALLPEVAANATDRFSMVRVKWRGHPDRFNRRTLQRTRLNLPAGEGLSAPTHFGFFANNVLATEINREGPAPTALIDYLIERGGDVWSRLHMKRIADVETVERLNRMVRLESVRIRLSDDSITHLHALNNTYFPVLRSAASLVDDGGVFEVSWKRFRNNGHLNAEALKALVLNIVENDENMAALDSKSQIELVGFDANNREDTYVLKRDYVQSKQSIPRDANGNVSDDDAFAALERGYNAAKDHFTEQLFILPT